MSQKDLLSYKSIDTSDTLRKLGRIVIVDVCDEVRDFLTSADMSCSDTSYDVHGILERYTDIRTPSTATIVALATDFFEARISRDRDDCEILADYASRQLYPDISDRLHRYNLEDAVVHRVSYRITANRSILCKIIFRAL